MKRFKRQVELVVIRDIMGAYDDADVYTGTDLEQLIKQAFDNRVPLDDVRFYLNGNLANEIFPPDSRKDKKAIRQFCATKGRVVAIVRPMGLETLFVVAVSVLVSVAVALLMPVPQIPSNAANSPPSPNTALAARGNRQRLGGRIADIYGTVWSIPDLIAPTYSVYVGHKEVEYSAMCVGRGRFDVKQALDDTTPITQVFGSTVLVYDPNTTYDDTPAFQFGNTFTPDEAQNARFFAKRYTAVNGQTLRPPDAYLDVKASFGNPNIITISDNTDLRDYFGAGDSILIEGAENLASGNGLLDVNDDPITYTLNGQYTIDTVSQNAITLVSPETINTDWQELTDNTDFTVETDGITISGETQTFWQGWHYTDLKDHDRAFYNIVAPQGLYDGEPSGRWKGLKIFGKIESELVDVNNNPIAGTLVEQEFSIASPTFEDYASEGFAAATGYYEETATDSNKESLRDQAAVTVFINNPNFVIGTRLRSRIARTSIIVSDSSGGVSDEIKIKDFYGARIIAADDLPSNITKVYSKTVATEGALAVKERNLRLLVQRYVQDATTGTEVLSNRIDDIMRTIALDAKIGNLTLSQIDVNQIESEVEAIIAHFGTELCAEFCGTFDDVNTSAEEMLQAVATAAFSSAKRQDNMIRIDFERPTPAPVAIFNSRNILPNSYSAPESFGTNKDYNGAEVSYVNPEDDSEATLFYPDDTATNPHTEKLIGVRNKVQAHMHLMRIYNKDQHAYKTCEITAGDESNIVVRTNRVAIANQRRTGIIQGAASGLIEDGGNIILETADPVALDPAKSYTMFLQTINNGVDAIDVTPRDDYSVNLARLPAGEIALDGVVSAAYQIATDTAAKLDNYIVVSKEPSEGITNRLTCTNYDERYYQNDSDFINDLIP